MTIGEAIRAGEDRLREWSLSPRLDAEMLLAHVLGCDRTFFITHDRDVLGADVGRRFEKLLAERLRGMPVAYLVQQKEFCGRDFFVDDRVLIPRPETEMLIDAAKRFVSEKKLRSPRVLDIGTGSGCIAVTLAKEIPGANVTATDRSADAIAVAEKNALTHDAAVRFYNGNLFDALSSPHELFDVIVSNPPYVAAEEVDSVNVETRSLHFEPRAALVADAHDSFACIRQIIENAPAFLAEHGALLIEIGYDHGEQARASAARSFPQKIISITKDLAGFDRLLTVAVNRANDSKTP